MTVQGPLVALEVPHAEGYPARRNSMGVTLRYRVVAENDFISYGGLMADAKEALAKVTQYEREGFPKITIWDEDDQPVMRDELARLAGPDAGAVDT